jgi:hypothetical protein
METENGVGCAQVMLAQTVSITKQVAIFLPL